MSPLDFVTIKVECYGINHIEDHYQTKDMKLWGSYLVAEDGKLYRKDDDHPEWTFENYTGEFSVVGGDVDVPGYYVLTFTDGELETMTHWLYDNRHWNKR